MVRGLNQVHEFPESPKTKSLNLVRYANQIQIEASESDSAQPNQIRAFRCAPTSEKRVKLHSETTSRFGSSPEPGSGLNQVHEFRARGPFPRNSRTCPREPGSA